MNKIVGFYEPVEAALTKNELKTFRSLREKSTREQEGMFFSEGLKCTLDLFRYGLSPRYILFTSAHRDWAAENFPGVEKRLITPTQAEQLSLLKTPPGLMGIFGLPALADIKTLPAGEWSLYLDGINDPGNTGTIIRTAHWFGVRHIILSPGAADPFNPKVVQSSMGSLAFCQFYRAGTTAFSNYKPVYLADLEGMPLQEITPASPGLIVLGSESHGVSESWNRVDGTVKVFIPAVSASHPESLNVAVSAGIVLNKLVLSTEI